jgi:Tol biopolymer transport system component
MNLDDRGRRAVDQLHRELDEPPGLAGDPFERFERSLSRKSRNQRLGAVLVAGALTVLGIVLAVRALGPAHPSTPAAPLPGGTILYGEWDQRHKQAEWFTLRSDGSHRANLHVLASCAVWFPGGDRILITDDADRGPGSPLRPAVIGPNGSNREALDGTKDPDLELGCGDVSPDGSRLVLEGFSERDTRLNGIYSVRASDGGDLVRLTSGLDGPPRYSPDGTKVLFTRTKPGILPDGAGALFVMNADGTGLRRITPWGSAFIDQAWSPDGRWIAFQKPYGELFLVRPDGSGMHQVPVDLPAGSGARQPSWSPDGDWIVFSLTQGQTASIYAVRPDGTGLTPITEGAGSQDSAPDWRP